MSIAVAVLGATGTVGQKLVRMVCGHPRLTLAGVAASERSQGQAYREATQWREGSPLPREVAEMTVCAPQQVTAPFALSALPASQAREIEPYLAQRGVHVVSNASALRMEPAIPLLIPEINPCHLSLLERQTTPGKIVTNPNCAAVFITLALAPLLELGELEHVSLTTLQGISGAGYPGVSAMDIAGNIIPYIPTEEQKIQEETKRILGTPEQPAAFSVTAQVHRVPVLHGHSIALHLFFRQPVSAISLPEQYQKWNQRHPDLFRLYQDPYHPQPRADLHDLDQRVHIGRITQGDRPHIVGLISQGHNLVRGAAGAALLNLLALAQYLNQKER